MYLLVCSQGNIYNKRTMGFRSMKLAGIERWLYSGSVLLLLWNSTVQYENWGVVPPSTGPNFPISRLGCNLQQQIFIDKNKNNLNPDFKGKCHISCKISTVLFYVLIWWSQPIWEVCSREWREDMSQLKLSSCFPFGTIQPRLINSYL